MKLQTACAVIVIAIAARGPEAAAWDRHDLITRYTLKECASGAAAPAAAAGPRVRPETIERFLMSERHGVAGVFERHYAEMKRLAANGGVPWRIARTSAPLPSVISTLPVFLAAAKLNPLTPFRTEPGGRALTPCEVLTGHADEPDDGLDQDLWAIPSYGLGTPPYGSAAGKESQAAFHMQFVDENVLLRLAMPAIRDGMASARMALFLRLARFAHQTGHPYWGYRFTALALHYLEDIAQPYHARAMPMAGPLFYLKFLFTRDKTRLKREAVQLLTDRHYALEKFVGRVLQDTAGSYQETQKLRAALAPSDRVLDASRSADAYTLFVQTALEAGLSARGLDKAVGENDEKRILRIVEDRFRRLGEAARALVSMSVKTPSGG